MIGGERARAGARPVEKHARDNSETPEPVTHQVNHDPPVQGVITESAGNTFNTVISWLQGRVRGNPSRTDSKVSNLTLGSGSRLKEVLGTQFGRPSKNIEGSRSLTIESDDQASDCSKSIFRPARKSSSKRQPETNISSYVILPVRRPKTASRKDRGVTLTLLALLHVASVSFCDDLPANELLGMSCWLWVCSPPTEHKKLLLHRYEIVSSTKPGVTRLAKSFTSSISGFDLSAR